MGQIHRRRGPLWFSWLGLYTVMMRCARNVAKFIFPKKRKGKRKQKKKEKCPCFYNLKMNLTRLKNYVTSMKCPYKNRRFLLKKIHFKKVKKDHVEEMIPLKKNNQKNFKFI